LGRRVVGVAGGRGRVVKYYYISSCTGSVRKWWLLKRNWII